jgi:hypothetical protein
LNVKDGVETQAQADKGLYTLRIPQVDTTKHMGAIICRAENAIGTVEHTLQLNITTAPTLKGQLKDIEILRGQDGTLSVDVQGYPIPEIIWTRGNEKIIELNDKYTWSDDQHRQLIIHNVQIDDEDEYNVRIHNEFGEVTSKAKLSCLSKKRKNKKFIFSFIRIFSIFSSTKYLTSNCRRYNITTW